MKNRYWVVAWNDYYPRKLLDNVHSKWPTQSEAESAASELRVSQAEYYDHVEVVDALVFADGEREDLGTVAGRPIRGKVGG